MPIPKVNCPYCNKAASFLDTFNIFKGYTLKCPCGRKSNTKIGVRIALIVIIIFTVKYIFMANFILLGLFTSLFISKSSDAIAFAIGFLSLIPTIFMLSFIEYMLNSINGLKKQEFTHNES